MVLPPALITRLSSRARSILSTTSGEQDEKELNTDQRVFAALTALHTQGQLNNSGLITPEIALDIAIVYPKISRRLFVDESIISTQLLVQASEHLVLSLPSNPKTREEIKSLRLLATCLECALLSWPSSIAHSLSRTEPNDIDSSLLRKVVTVYAALGRASKILGGGKWNLNDPEPEPWKLDLVKSKISLLQVVHVIISTACEEQQSKDSEAMMGVLFELIGDTRHINDHQGFGDDHQPGTSSGGAGSPTPFVDRTLLGDYEAVFHLLARLRGIHDLQDDARVDLIEQQIMASDGWDDPSPGGVIFLLPQAARERLSKPTSTTAGGAPTRSARPSRPVSAVIDSKGKGKATDPVVEDHNPILESQIDEIQMILPDTPQEHIRGLLLDARYGGDTARVIEAILEGVVPDPTPQEEDTKIPESDPPPRPSQNKNNKASTRANVFDTEELDVAKLRIGKQTIARPTIDTAMKEEILRRVAELSSSSEGESDGEGGPAEREYTWDDLDGHLSPVDAKPVKVAAGGEGSGEDSEPGEADLPKPPDAPETIIELAYLKDPELFGRTADIRRSKARAQLRTSTGWSDEQIEGWKVMLDRNPKKEKVLQKHEFSGNTPLSFEEMQKVGLVPAESHGHRGGRGGRGRGGGRGGGGRGGSASGAASGSGSGPAPGGGGEGGGDKRQQARSEKNKAREGNHNRKRGHDKKMARGGGGGFVG